MNGNQDVALSWVLTSATGISAMTTADLVGMIFTIICGVASLAFTIWRWYRAAKKDGKITKEEVEDLIDDVVEQVDKTADDVKDKIDNSENN